MKYFLLIIILCSSTVFAAIQNILVEKKEPASATCYMQMDPMVIGITVEVPYSQVAFLFNDTKVTDLSIKQMWIAYKDKEVVHLICDGSYKIKANVLKPKFKIQLLKLREDLEKKVN